MYRLSLLTQLQMYQASPLLTAEEIPMVDRLFHFVKKNAECFDRPEGGHVTSSAWIVNSTLTHVLLTHHKKFNLWVQLGGHNDGDSECSAVALKEAREESGIDTFSMIIPTIFDVDIHEIPSKCAYHYDVRYLIKAEHDKFIVSEESHDLAWVPIQEVEKYSKERSVLRMNDKLKTLLKGLRSVTK